MAAILVATFAAYPQPPITPNSEIDTSSIQSPNSNHANLQKGPPPMPLSGWGPELQSFDQAKTESGLTAASLPAKIPVELTFDSVRVLSSPGEPTSIATAFYTPHGLNADDSITFQEIMSGGGIAIVYEKESLSPNFDREKWMAAFVSEAPDVRRIEDINGTPAVVNTGNAEQGITYQVLFYKNGIQINLVSLKYGDADLIEIAKTIG